MQGITPFCITIDRESEAELRDLYGEIGYTIIDDVLPCLSGCREFIAG